MEISARNQLQGTVSAIERGAVNGVVAIKIGPSQIKASITMEAIEELKLEVGSHVFAVVKATNVVFASGDARIAEISARNQLAGTVKEVTRGAVNGHVKLELPDGQVVTGSITNDAINDLGIVPGRKALAIIKASDIMVGV